MGRRSRGGRCLMSLDISRLDISRLDISRLDMSGPERERLALSAVFIGSGVPKLLGLAPMRAFWRFYRLPSWFLIFTGAVELAAGLAIARRDTADLGGALSVLVMGGAVIANGRDRRSWPLILVNIAIAGLALRVVRNALVTSPPSRAG